MKLANFELVWTRDEERHANRIVDERECGRMEWNRST
jgi:hypothetical protein